MSYNISGIQQMGIGVEDVDSAWAWYRKHFGMDVPVFREAAEAPLMTRYTGAEVQSRDALLALNLQGGGGMEIWQFTSRIPAAPAFKPSLLNPGLFAARIRSRDVLATHNRFAKVGVQLETGPLTDPNGAPHFFVKDPAGHYFDVVAGDGWFADEPTRPSGSTGGPAGCMINVTDIDRSLPLYRDLLGYDTVRYDEIGVFEDLRMIPGGTHSVRRILLGHAAPRLGPFSELFGPSELELVQVLDRGSDDENVPHLFADRFWGDLGFIHLCFDVTGMDALKHACESAGFPFTIDSEDSFDMGEAAGRFAYIEDPDGTLIEFVETHKMPLLKKIGLHLDLRKRSPTKPLPRMLIKALGLARVKD